MKRVKTKCIYVGDVPVGGDSPITVQSMTNTITADIESTVSQILELERHGCHIIRAAVNNREDALAINQIKKRTHIPFIADIQFDYRLGIQAVENGCDCLRINPGNIGSERKVREIVDCCKEYEVPIRIGVNSGSLSRKIIDKYGGVNTDSLVESAIDQLDMLEKLNFYNTKISIKSSDVNTMIDSYIKLSKKVDYPLHLGVTEAGPMMKSTVKSSIGIGSLLRMGIGDTLRVSITGNPVDEVVIGREILKSLSILNEGIDLISCPTCSRTKINLIELVEKAEMKLDQIDKNASIAIMGCPVNGPGEAREADLGIACGDGFGVIFKKGKIIKRVKEEELLDALLKEVELL
ncbi:MAG: flavodoxin-dependent (E)-4-hydroxy-3-methylbut-2-enyl-diphosphate synthase [Tissierellia bacterium]|nr:flavodoxin-dependent (E)-4-hydroxy-3-methylbut-2-enyl-diphosphate synthase [Tissierellia bacterium]